MHKAIIPPGTYFLGDPCYAVPSELWSDLIESADYFDNTCFGTVMKDGVSHRVLAFSTAYGDGEYYGSDGVSYGVDAGLIGLTPIELCDKDMNSSSGSIVTFDAMTVCTNEDGNLRFGEIYIDTMPDNETEDDYDYDNYDGDYWDDED